MHYGWLLIGALLCLQALPGTTLHVMNFWLVMTVVGGGASGMDEEESTDRLLDNFCGVL